MTVWIDTLQQLPTDGQSVWIRVVNYYGDAVIALFNDTDKTFTTTITNIIIPAYEARRWKPSSPAVGSAKVGVDLVVG